VILVDSIVWIDSFRGNLTSQTDLLEELLDSQELALGDWIFTEILQGCKFDKDFNDVRRLLRRWTSLFWVAKM
jgi:predicted nucleic acid-binding protein